MTERFAWERESIPIREAIDVLEEIELDHPDARLSPTEGGVGVEVTVSKTMYGPMVRFRSIRPR